jgi:hypothetical protein
MSLDVIPKVCGAVREAGVQEAEQRFGLNPPDLACINPAVLAFVEHCAVNVNRSTADLLCQRLRKRQTRQSEHFRAAVKQP